MEDEQEVSTYSNKEAETSDIWWDNDSVCVVGVPFPESMREKFHMLKNFMSWKIHKI